MEQKLEELVESDIIEPVEGPIPTLSGPKSGQNLEKGAAHPHQKFLGVHPRGYDIVSLERWCFQ